MNIGLNKPFNRSSVIAKQLLKKYGCAKIYNDSHFLILSKVRNEYFLYVFIHLFVETFRLNICKQLYFYKSSLYC